MTAVKQKQVQDMDHITRLSAGDLLLLNYHLVDPKGGTLSAVMEAFSRILPNHKTAAIIFRAQLPDIVDGDIPMGGYVENANVIFVNVSPHYDVAKLNVMGGEHYETSIRSLAWFELLTTIAHELKHAEMHNSGADTSMSKDDVEAACEEMTKEVVVNVVKTVYHINPPVNGLMDKLYLEDLEEIKASDKVWAEFQTAIADQGLTFLGNDGTKIHNFREWIRINSGDYNDPSWDVAEQKATTAEMVVNMVHSTNAVPVDSGTSNIPVDYEMSAVPVDSGAQAAPVDFEMSAVPVDSGTPNAPVDFEMSAVPVDSGAQAAPVDTGTLMSAMTPVATAETFTADPAVLSNSVLTVYRRLLINIFTKCGWNPNSTTSESGFEQAGNVAEALQIADIPLADKIFAKMDCIHNGRWTREVPCNGVLVGSVTKGGLPKYDLHINKGDGVLHKYLIIAQNKNKTSQSAERARLGHRILMLYRTGESRPFFKVEAGTDPVTKLEDISCDALTFSN